METIRSLDEISSLRDNLVYCSEKANILIENSQIQFRGKNNLLYIFGDVEIMGSKIEFAGDNGLVIIGRLEGALCCKIFISHESTILIGNNSSIGADNICGGLQALVSEHMNLIIGDDSMLSFGICMRTADPHLIYDCSTLERVNWSKSIVLGEHTWVGQNALLLKGTNTGCGAIIAANSVVSNKQFSHNTCVAGNPARKVKEDIFWLREHVHWYHQEDTEKSAIYQGDSTFNYTDDDDQVWRVLDEILLVNPDPVIRLEIVKEFYRQRGIEV